eukprot:scaffold1044_cov266-Pinguiococcus_pyrenoidosus.AAC.4
MFVYLNGDWKDEYAGHLEVGRLRHDCDYDGLPLTLRLHAAMVEGHVEMRATHLAGPGEARDIQHPRLQLSRPRGSVEHASAPHQAEHRAVLLQPLGTPARADR